MAGRRRRRRGRQRRGHAQIASALHLCHAHRHPRATKPAQAARRQTLGCGSSAGRSLTACELASVIGDVGEGCRASPSSSHRSHALLTVLGRARRRGNALAGGRSACCTRAQQITAPRAAWVCRRASLRHSSRCTRCGWPGRRLGYSPRVCCRHCRGLQSGGGWWPPGRRPASPLLASGRLAEARVCWPRPTAGHPPNAGGGGGLAPPSARCPPPCFVLVHLPLMRPTQLPRGKMVCRIWRALVGRPCSQARPCCPWPAVAWTGEQAARMPTVQQLVKEASKLRVKEVRWLQLQPAALRQHGWPQHRRACCWQQ